MDFSTLLNTKPPLLEIASPYRKKSNHDDPAINLNDYLQNPAQIILSGLNQRETRISMKSDFLSNMESENQISSRESQEKSGRGGKPQSQPQREHEKILLSGNIAKRHPYFIFFQTRFLVLSEVAGQLRLRYYNPSTNELRVR